MQEALQDLNEQLEESHNQTENDLREEVDLKENKVREVNVIWYGALIDITPSYYIHCKHCNA